MIRILGVFVLLASAGVVCAQNEKPQAEKSSQFGVIKLGTHRRIVDELLGYPEFGSTIPVLSRTLNYYADGTRVTFFDERAISVVPGANARPTLQGGVILQAAENEVLVAPELLPRCGQVPLSPALKCGIEEMFFYSPPVRRPVLPTTGNGLPVDPGIWLETPIP
ncbi:MAG: hypothetical protein KatS3mg105_0671 [Gemmatales bacterium]|nr:MAG: hypothetical protein KatS3mg105_0671 [Gemmatales bacterium]